MQLKHLNEMFCLIALLLLGLAPIQMSRAQSGADGDLQIFYYSDHAALYEALKAGDIDMSFWPVTPAQYLDAIADPNIQLAPVPRLDVFAFSLNNNETISRYPGVKSPMTSVNFRKAIHRLSSKPYFPEFTSDMPVPIAPPSSSWWNQSVVNFVKGNAPGRYPYPYESLTFNRAAAEALLDSAGFIKGADGWRKYPATWPQKAGQPLDPLEFSIRSDDALRRAAGLDLAAELEAVGVPVNEIVEPFSAAYIRVMRMRNYHIYTSGWSVGRFPTYLYGWFHSSRWFPGGSNYHLSTTPQYADIDAAVDKVQYPPSYWGAMLAAMHAQYLLTEKYTVMIPLWSTRSFYPFSANLLGVTNYHSVGPENDYTYLKAWKTEGGPIRAGLKAPPLEVNQIYSSSVWDVSTMKPFMADFLSQAPYNIMCDQPWLAQDWTSPPGTWLDGAVEKSKMTFWFRDDPSDGLDDSDAEWIEPVTGNVLDDFTPQWLGGGGYEFNSWYYASEPAGNIYPSYKDIHHIRIYPSEKKAEVYFNVKSYWSIYWAQDRPIYAPAWKQTALATLETKVFVEGVNATTPGFLSLPYKVVGAPVEIVEIKEDTTALTKASGGSGNDYEIVLGKIRIYRDIAAGKTITVKYWARGSPSGYAPGDLYVPDANVGTVWIGTGTHYVIEHVPGVGGWTTYKKNPHFFLGTPPKGEIDFWWNWISGPKPGDGYYMVDVLDVVRATWAIDGEGWAVPSPNWEPGADLTQEVHKCLITLHDSVVVAADFFKTFGSPPPNPPP